MAAAFAYSSATSLPLAPLCAGTYRMVTSLSCVRGREQTSMAGTAKRQPGLRASSLTRSIALVELANALCLYPHPWRWSEAWRA